MINQEEIYQLLFQEKWPGILKILHQHKTEIAGDTLLQHAATTFEDTFFQKLPLAPIDDRVIKESLDIMYPLHFGKFYRFRTDNEKLMIKEMVKRYPLQEAYNYALLYPDEIVCKETIKQYEQQFPKKSPIKRSLTSANWIEVYNRLFELINNKEDIAAYFSGPRFINLVRNRVPYHPEYSQFIELRNQEGKSTSRKIFYYDILLGLEENLRLHVIDDILALIKPFHPIKASAIDMLLGKEYVNPTMVETTVVKPLQSSSPVVFISYSHDDDEHKKWVGVLADRLKGHNIDVILDRTHLKLGGSIPQFIEQSLERAIKVLIIFTPNYKLKADKRSGGVGYEYSIVNQELYENQRATEKIIPIRRKGIMKESIPTFMRQFFHLDMSNDANFETGLMDLVREILDDPALKT